jgi:branched-chain amino acid transport system ATP-binding protein
MATLLEIDDISRTFGGVAALSRVSFNVGERELVGLVGPNGSGKTTLINILTGLLRASSGSLRFEGVDYTDRPAYQVAHMGLARTFQNIHLFSDLTVLENVQVGFHHRCTQATLLATLLQLPGHRQAERRTRSEGLALLDRLGIVHVASRLPAELSYGLQRRVEIARALAIGPRLLLLDEPTAGMAWSESLEIASVLKGVRDSGVTVLIVEHNVRLLAGICDRMVALSSGRLVAEGKPNEVLRNEEVLTAYLGQNPKVSPLELA